MKKALLVLAAIAVIGGVSYTLVSRNVLKSFFEKGDKPTQAQFTDTIDSAVNMQDDGITTMKQNAGGPTKQYVDDTESGTAARAPQTKVVAEGQKQFSLEANQSVTFRWTPITPKPKEPVTYRIRVWQMMQGQTGNTAMAKNEPVVTREVTGSSEVTVSGILTGPCRPPYLCDFVWSVESVSKSDAASGSGGSAPSAVQSSPADVPKPTEVAPESASGGVAR